MHVVIRNIKPDQWQVHRQVRLAALASDPHVFGSRLAQNAAFSDDVWQAWNPRHVWLAYDGEDPIGMVRLSLDEDIPEIISLWVAPRARRTGVATMLINAVVDHVRTFADEVKLAVFETNEKAMRLYESLGFEFSHTAVSGVPGVSESVLVKKLSPAS